MIGLKNINMKKNIKFGILGLGRVVEKRVYEVFQNELKNSQVVSVFDKNKKVDMREITTSTAKQMPMVMR